MKLFKFFVALSVAVVLSGVILRAESETSVFPDRRPFDFVGNFPLRMGEKDSRSLDTPSFLKAYSDLNMATYHYSFKVHATDRILFQGQFEPQVLSQLGKSKARIVVDQSMGRPFPASEITQKTSPTGNVYYEDKFGRSAPKAEDFTTIVRAEANEEVRELANLSKKYPQNLVGFQEDDFLAKRKAMTTLDRNFFKKICHEARAIHHSFKFRVTLYCHSDPGVDIKGEKHAFANFMSPNELARIDFAKPTWEVQAFLNYISDPEADDCIDEVALYNMGRGSEAGKMMPWSNVELKDTEMCLQEIKTKFNRPVKVGIYMSGYPSLDLKDRMNNIHLALNTSAEGFVFFMTPIKPFDTSPSDEEMNKRIYDYIKSQKVENLTSEASALN